MTVTFLLNGEAAEAEGPPTRTLLDWLREERGLQAPRRAATRATAAPAR